MFQEFFFNSDRKICAWAWTGLCTVIGHSFLRAYVKKLMNDWLQRFYDVGCHAAETPLDDYESLMEGQTTTRTLLLQFCLLCVPSVVMDPFFTLISNRWVLSWRIELMKSYFLQWKPTNVTVENASQRIHEDSARFARGIQTCAVVLLDSFLTICVFAPVMLELGTDLQPTELPACWVLVSCVSLALTGVLVSVLLGWSLIALEVENQSVEADLRKALVLREEHVKENSTDERLHETTCQLRTNYVKLYNRFAGFKVWLGTYEQSIVLLPYMLTAPMLYSTTSRVTLGTVTRASHSFSNMFDALNVLSDRWLEVTDFLSVIRRLSEFESNVISSRSTRASLIVGAEMTRSSDE